MPPLAPEASAQRYPRERECGERPAGVFPGTASHAPGLDTLAAVLRVVARSAVQQPTGVFLLTTDSTGAQPSVQVLGSNVPRAAHPRLLQVANAYLDSHPPGERMFFRVELDGGGELPADHPVRFCLPHVRNLGVVRSYLQMATHMESSYERMGTPARRTPGWGPSTCWWTVPAPCSEWASARPAGRSRWTTTTSSSACR